MLDSESFPLHHTGEGLVTPADLSASVLDGGL